MPSSIAVETVLLCFIDFGRRSFDRQLIKFNAVSLTQVLLK